MSAENPPAFEQPSPVLLDSVKDSKIANVSLYSGRAEVTRLFKFTVRVGQNAVHIRGLPTVLDKGSLRVEGRGSATIHDVTVSSMASRPLSVTSEVLTELISSKTRTEKALERCKKSVASLESFLTSINVQHVNSTDLGTVMENYDSVGERLDNKMSELEANLKAINAQIDAERSRLSGPVIDEQLRFQASIGVFAEQEGEVEIALIYAVSNATWSAAYDIRVNMDAADKPVTLIYKAAIHQNSGESWEDVPLLLETASPTYGVGLPTLRPWTVSLVKTPPAQILPAGRSMSMSAKRRLASKVVSKEEIADSSDDEMGFGIFDDPMPHQSMAVHSKGNVNATFRVPGLNSVPSDGSVHNFTIVQMSLEATMTWISVPKHDTRTHLNAKIKNVSEFTLLYGPSSVYVDGSFVSGSIVPAVSPQESFDCPLGLDPSVRIVYHPRSKKLSQSGFYSKSSNYIFTQRISIHNTKTKPINRLKLIDHIPVSEDAQCVVKLISPPMSSFQSSTQTSSMKTAEKAAIKISEGVVAQWDGADEPGVDLEALGKDGKLNWICSVAPQDKINLTLQWEVTVPLKASVTGL